MVNQLADPPPSWVNGQVQLGIIQALDDRVQKVGSGQRNGQGFGFGIRSIYP